MDDHEGISISIRSLSGYFPTIREGVVSDALPLLERINEDPYPPCISCRVDTARPPIVALEDYLEGFTHHIRSI